MVVSTLPSVVVAAVVASVVLAVVVEGQLKLVVALAISASVADKMLAQKYLEPLTKCTTTERPTILFGPDSGRKSST